MSRLDQCQFGFGGGLGLYFSGCPVCNIWAGSGSSLFWVWKRKDLVFSMEQLDDWEAGLSGPLVLKVASAKNLKGGLRGLKGPSKKNDLEDTAVRPRFGVPHSKGDLTGYSPAACRAHRAAHSCLWDWELCRPPEDFGLQSCLACRRPRARN